MICARRWVAGIRMSRWTLLSWTYLLDVLIAKPARFPGAGVRSSCGADTLVRDDLYRADDTRTGVSAPPKSGRHEGRWPQIVFSLTCHGRLQFFRLLPNSGGHKARRQPCREAGRQGSGEALAGVINYSHADVCNATISLKSSLAQTPKSCRAEMCWFILAPCRNSRRRILRKLFTLKLLDAR